ncbi:MAG: FtsQ-type POTRA domain-containing protein [Bacteroidetes bacterium]|nr:FtsQ-type POTRA domain-containing protein [Bacteroidota bacterium]
MQLHIRKSGEEPKGYAPLHEAKPLDELEQAELGAEFVAEEDDEPKSWKSSRYVPYILLAAVLLLGGIVFFAREFQSAEGLQAIRVEGNRQLMTSEVLLLASIDKSQKFYDIDLRTIEQRIAKHGFVRDVSIRRETHPNTIVIRVNERMPLAMIRSSSGEPVLVDNDYRFFLPKRLSGLMDPNKLLAVPVLGGVNEKDTAAIIEMSHIVRQIVTMGDSSLREALGELRRTPTGAYVMYTSVASTPIFIGSPSDVRFTTTLERETDPSAQKAENERLFDHQLHLLATLWKQKLRAEIWSRSTLYVDARFNGQIIVRHKGYGASLAKNATPAADSARTVRPDSAIQRSLSTTSPTTAVR